MIIRGHGSTGLDLLLSHPEAQKGCSIQSFFSSWAQDKKTDAMTRLETLPPGPIQDQAAAGIALVDYSDQKLDLLDRYPGAATDIVLAKVLESTPAELQPGAVEHALKIQNEALRDQTLIANLQLWCRIDPDQSKLWIQAHSLSETVQKALANPPPDPFANP